MIVIRVELWSAVNGQKTELARMVVDNIGGTGTQREARVMGHPRLREHVWNLVAKSLTAMGYGLPKEPK